MPLLVPGGWLYLELPDLELYPSQVSDMVWHEHTYHFTHAAIRKLLMKTGFTITDIHSPGPSYGFGMAIFAQKTTDRKSIGPSWYVPDPAAHCLAVQCFNAHFLILQRYRFALRRELDRLLKQVRTKRCKLAIYGTGIFYNLLYTYTNLGPNDVTIVVDDNSEKRGKSTREGPKIEPPAHLVQRKVDVVLIASDCFESKMRENVLQWTFEHGREYEPFCPHTRVLKAVGIGLEKGGEDAFRS